MFGYFKKKRENPPAQPASPPALPQTPPPLPTKPPLQQDAQGFHVNQELIPENELEQILLDAKQGKVAYQDALNCFFRSEVKILDTDFDPKQPNKVYDPFHQYGPDNELLLAIFSSSNRAIPHRERRREFRYLKTFHASDLIRDLLPGVGLVLNPGWKVGLQLTPERIAQIKSS